MLTTGQTHEKPHRADKRRGGVVCGVLLSVLQVVGLDLRNKGGGQSGELGNLPDVPVLLPPAADGGDVLLAVARLDRWAASLGSVGAGGGGLRFRLRGASFASKGCGCVADFGVGAHGVFWLIGALAPADVKTIPNRFGFARKIANYFHGPKSGSFSSLNSLYS